MKRLLLLVGLFLVVCQCLVGCGGGSPQLPVPQLAGQWEIVATNSNAYFNFPDTKVHTTHIEVNFNEDSQGNLSASDPILFAEYMAANPVVVELGGYCGLPGPNPISGSVKTNNKMNFTWTEGAGVQFTGSGQLQNGTVTGSYGGGDTTLCQTDSGTFVATRAQNIGGTYVGGYQTHPSNSFGSLTLTITTANDNSITVDGSDSASGNFKLQGAQTGNGVVVSGTIGVLSSTFYGLLVTTSTTQLSFFDQDYKLVAFLTKQ